MTKTTTGVIGDIHLDLNGLKEVLKGPLRSCDAFVVTGDILDRGSGDPVATLKTVLALPNVLVLCGNHELVYLGGPRYPGMFEERCAVVAPLLRDLVIDGILRASATVGDVLCTHGGVSRSWTEMNYDVSPLNAHELSRSFNRVFLNGVVRRTFTHPLFDALDAVSPGPFWASARDDLLERGTPPFDQVVGHVPLDDRWHPAPYGGRVFSVCRERAAEGEDSIGYTILEGRPT